MYAYIYIYIYRCVRDVGDPPRHMLFLVPKMSGNRCDHSSFFSQTLIATLHTPIVAVGVGPPWAQPTLGRSPVLAGLWSCHAGTGPVETLRSDQGECLWSTVFFVENTPKSEKT